ncbi:sensor histidine kinase [Anabaena azotica]|uniref:histidine kinase n=1 Tax=Anabaena azotica FACHB-119 TaxID=947527 RepID=A0ABR8DEB7_9NOST|nr:HAMP domain-containing sensor histidine kinase [Anabaena azotica]MBD2505532.1 HAMP domain-containing histidine kinase [Anabaena azotica FACHB-119]
MQPEIFTKNLELSGLLHDISNAFKGASIIVNQIIDGAYGQSLEEIRPLLMTLQKTNERGISLVEAKKSSEEVREVTRFDMLDFLQKTYSLFKPIAQYHSLNLHYETQESYTQGTEVRAELVNIDRMICNILTNAIKYTKQGDIFLRLLNQGDNLVIEIEDTGCGIAAEQLSNIFIPFWRSPTVESNQSGVGMGLYIVLCVVHAHGLSMKVDSVVGQGTKFTIIFPYKENGIYGVDGKMLPKSHRRQDALPI